MRSYVGSVLDPVIILTVNYLFIVTLV